MSSRASGGALAASLITAAIIGFAGGAYFGTQADGSGANGNTPSSSAPASTPGNGTPPDGGAADGSAEEETPAASGLNLTSPVNAVAPNGRIDLAGSISPAAAGVKVQIQRSVDGGAWENFNIGAWVTGSDGTFSGWIQSQRQGTNSLRVVRVDDPTVMSNTIDVKIG